MKGVTNGDKILFNIKEDLKYFTDKKFGLRIIVSIKLFIFFTKAIICLIFIAATN
jgi:hypothetical protein